jgi:hypothetical protein
MPGSNWRPSVNEGDPWDGANSVEEVDKTELVRTRRRRKSSLASAPFDGRPIIYGAIGYIALGALLVIAAALFTYGSGWIRLVFVMLVGYAAIRLIWRLISRF